MTRMYKSLYRLLLTGFLSTALLAGCGGGGNGDGGAGPTPSVIQPVSSSGQITAPPSVSPSTLTVVSGIDSQPVNSTGSFSLSLNKDNTQLVMAVNNQDNPVLMAIVVNAQSGTQIPINVQSTAEALVYLSPGIAQDISADAQTVVNYIKALPETSALANILASKIAANPDILASDIVDPEINTALSSAIQALINKVRQHGGLQGSALLRAFQAVTPQEASGVKFIYDGVTQKLECRNYMKRYVYVYEEDILPLFKLSSISSIGMLVDTIINREFTDFTSQNVTLADPMVVHTFKAYGLGFKDISNTVGNMTSSDWINAIPPMASTAVVDWMSPIVGVVVGVNNLQAKATNGMALFATLVAENPQLQLEIPVKAINEDYKEKGKGDRLL